MQLCCLLTFACESRSRQLPRASMLCPRPAAVMDIFGVSDYSSSPECVACLEAAKDTILLPCRHLCVCTNCFDNLSQDKYAFTGSSSQSSPDPHHSPHRILITVLTGPSSLQSSRPSRGLCSLALFSVTLSSGTLRSCALLWRYLLHKLDIHMTLHAPEAQFIFRPINSILPTMHLHQEQHLRLAAQLPLCSSAHLPHDLVATTGVPCAALRSNRIYASPSHNLAPACPTRSPWQSRLHQRYVIRDCSFRSDKSCRIWNCCHMM